MANNTDPILIDISNAFYTGNYQQCITLSEKVKVKIKILNIPTHHSIIQFFRNQFSKKTYLCIVPILQLIAIVLSWMK